MKTVCVSYLVWHSTLTRFPFYVIGRAIEETAPGEDVASMPTYS
jgi:hypothetical protein